MKLLSATATLLLTTTSHATTCEQGNASNSCNGLLHQCTSNNELCVIDTSTGSCCTVSSSSTAVMRSASTCRSNMDSSICSSSFVTGTTSTHIAEADVGVTTTGQECYNVEIGLILDDNPGDLAWEITSGRKSTLQQEDAEVVATSPYYDPEKYQQASDTYIVCLPKGRYTFTMIDLGGDGITQEGKYILSYKPTGELIAQGAQFGNSESTIFKVPYVAPQYIDSNGDGIEDQTENVIPKIPIGSDGQPACSNEFGLHLVTDDYGVETTWELRETTDGGDYTDGKIIASGGPYTSDYTYDISYCVNPGKYTFVFYDWQCDGLVGRVKDGYYTLKVNGMEVHTGGTDMERYDEVVELNFMNTLEDGALMKKSSSGANVMRVLCSIGLTLLASAFMWN